MMLTVECPSCERRTALEPELVELRCEECGVVATIAHEDEDGLRLAA
jgi:uncharacterized Zn finger protein